jgi:NAD+ synthase (glutamine-hydrolysing)
MKNADEIVVAMKKVRYQENYPDIVVFPELAITGYSCGDLFGTQHLIATAERELENIAAEVDNRTLVVVGAPVAVRGALYNCAVVMHGGRIVGVVPKSYLPNYKEFLRGEMVPIRD